MTCVRVASKCKGTLMQDVNVDNVVWFSRNGINWKLGLQIRPITLIREFQVSHGTLLDVARH